MLVLGKNRVRSGVSILVFDRVGIVVYLRASSDMFGCIFGYQVNYLLSSVRSLVSSGKVVVYIRRGGWASAR